MCCCLHHIELRAIVVLDDDAIEAHWRINSGLHGDKHWHARVSVLTHAITLSSRTHTHTHRVLSVPLLTLELRRWRMEDYSAFRRNF